MKDKIIVITGGAKGLGRAMAGLLKQAEAKVVISDIDQAALSQTAEDLDLIPFLADVSQEADVKKIVNETVAKFGRIDVWINNAGIWLPRCPVPDLDMTRVRQVFEVNVFGTMHGTIQALKQMQAQGHGTILNIISTSALMGRPLSAAYSASKHAIKGFTDSLREELKDDSIKVLAAYPGGIKTHLFDEGKPDDFDQYMDTKTVAEKIVANLHNSEPELDLILKRSGQEIN